MSRIGFPSRSIKERYFLAFDGSREKEENEKEKGSPNVTFSGMSFHGN
jgi:hypothetical protein